MSNPVLTQTIKNSAEIIDGLLNGAAAGSADPPFGFVLIGQSFRSPNYDAEVASNMSHKEKARLFKSLAEIEKRLAEDE